MEINTILRNYINDDVTSYADQEILICIKQNELKNVIKIIAKLGQIAEKFCRMINEIINYVNLRYK